MPADWQEAYLSRLFRRNWWVLGLLVSASLALAPWRFTLSVAAGGLLVIAGFHVLHYVLRRALRPDNEARDAKVVMVQYYLRLAALGLAIFALMRLRLVDPFGLLLGLSVVVINLLALAASEFRLLKEAA
jgi:hypothetical protein